MIVEAAAFVAGVWWLQQQPLLPALTGAIALVPALLGAWYLSARNDVIARPAARLMVVISCAIFGFYWAAACAGWKLADALPQNWEGRLIEVRGTVAEMTQPGERGTRFRFDVEQVLTPGASVPAHVSLVWYRESTEPPPLVSAAQRWRLAVRLRQPHGNVNPGGFDIEAWLLERGIRATGYVASDPAPRLESARVARPRYLVERLREHIRASLLERLGDRPYAGVIVALAIGDQQAIPPPQWRLFTRTGINHLMSISGLHITMVASLAFLLVMRGWRLSPRLLARLPAVRAATLAGLLTALGYAALSGFAVPAQRTVYMLAVVAAALWAGWTVRPLAVLAAAAAVVVLLDPMAIIAPGFWLSFGAVAVIMLAGGARIGRPGWLATWARVQWAVTIALVPLLLAMFQQVSLVSPLANAFAIPLVGLVVVPLSLTAAVLPLEWLALAAHGVMSACMWLLQGLDDLPAVVWQQHAPPPWTVALAVAGAAWMLLPRGFPARWAGAALLLPMFLVFPPAPKEGELWLTVLDVGQGLAAVARTREHALLFDAGPAYSEQIDAGERIVVPFLRATGVRRLDGLMVSHDDLDHSGGAASVLRALPVDWLSSSLPLSHPLNATQELPQRCNAGQAWSWNGVAFAVIHPHIESYNDAQRKDNDRSCVLKIASPYGSVLLPADVERAGEASLVEHRRADLPAQVLVVPHHGSRTSSAPAFLAAVDPRLAIIPVGYRNRFGHPHPVVTARYRSRGTAILRTDLAGAVTVRMTAQGWEITRERELDRRYWRNM